MGVNFDITVAGAEIFDSVIFMENSPAYAAFTDEIAKIITDLIKNGKFGSSFEVDVKALIDSSEETLIHMHHAFLIWTFNEDYGTKKCSDMEYSKLLKLFYKSQEKNLMAVNNGSKSVDVTEIETFKDKYLKSIASQTDVFNSVKDFFAGYVYGYFFNYLDEQKVMKDYAEFLVCLGIISNKISTTEAQKQKILPKMALLLNNDRFKYISGEIPLDVMFNIVYDRFELTNITAEEDKIIRDALREYLISNYDFREGEGLIADTVVTNVMTKLNPCYVCIPDFVKGLHVHSFDGVRTFLDGDKNDMGEYTYDKLLSIINDKCKENADGYYDSSREAVVEVALSADCKGYKYPLVYKEGDKFWAADIYKELIFPAADKASFASVSADKLPIAEYPFTESALRTNIIRFLGGLETTGFTVRTDKLPVLDEIAAIKKSDASDRDRRMMILEKLLYVISGNMDCKSYMHLLNDCVINDDLYGEYIRYRMDCLFDRGVQNGETKKKLLDDINSIT